MDSCSSGLRAMAGAPPGLVADAIEALDEGVMAVDHAGTVVYANGAAHELLGSTAGGLAGRPVADVVGLRYRLGPHGTRETFETWVRRQAGDRLPVAGPRGRGELGDCEVVFRPVPPPPAVPAPDAAAPGVPGRLPAPGDPPAPGTPAPDRPFALALVRRRQRSLARWGNLTRRLLDTLVVDDPLQPPESRLLAALGVELGWEVTALWFLHDDGHLECRYVWSDPASDPYGRLQAARQSVPPFEVNLPQHALAAGKPLWIPDLSEDPRFRDGPAARTGLRSALVFPVFHQGRAIGAVELFHRARLGDDLQMVDMVSAASGPVGQLLSALRQAARQRSLVRELEGERRRQSSLLRAGRSVAAAATYAEALDRLVEASVPWLADLCIIDVVDESGRIRRMACRHADPTKQPLAEALHRRFPPDPTGPHPSVAVLQTGRSAWSAEMTDEYLRATTRDERHYETVKRLEFTSFMTIPMLADQRVLGAVTLVSAGSGRHFGEDEGAWAEKLTTRFSSVVERAHHHDRQLAISHTLQQSLLPDHLPTVPGLDLAARYLPAAEGTEVGGDWYDVVVLEDQVVVVVGDVEGHDMHAATLMARLRHGLAALLCEDPSPAPALDRLREFTHRSGTNRLATVLVTTVDLARGTARIASAGHPPPVLRRPGHGSALVPVTPVPPLGICADRATETSVTCSDSLMVMVTDGLLEQPRSTLDARLGLLVSAVDAAPSAAGGACDYVLERMLGAAAPLDDVAIVGALMG